MLFRQSLYFFIHRIFHLLVSTLFLLALQSNYLLYIQYILLTENISTPIAGTAELCSSQKKAITLSTRTVYIHVQMGTMRMRLWMWLPHSCYGPVLRKLGQRDSKQHAVHTTLLQ